MEVDVTITNVSGNGDARTRESTAESIIKINRAQDALQPRDTKCIFLIEPVLAGQTARD